MEKNILNITVPEEALKKISDDMLRAAKKMSPTSSTSRNIDNQYNDIDTKVKTIVDFASYQSSILESEIVSIVRNNLDDLYKVKKELEIKMAELDFIDRYIREDEVYDWVGEYYDYEY